MSNWVMVVSDLRLFFPSSHNNKALIFTPREIHNGLFKRIGCAVTLQKAGIPLRVPVSPGRQTT
jgi:hypothetical protein